LPVALVALLGGCQAVWGFDTLSDTTRDASSSGGSDASPGDEPDGSSTHDAAPSDAGTGLDGTTQDASGGDDGGADVAACDPSKQFGTPTLVSNVNTASAEFDARLTTTETELYLSSNRPQGVGGFDIWVATRSGPGAAVGPASLLPGGVNTAGDEYAPTLVPDLGILYLGTSASSNKHVARATRPNLTSHFGAASAVASLDLANSSQGPSVLPDGSAIYFVASNPSFDIFTAKLGASDFDPPQPVTKVNQSSSNEVNPVISGDDLRLYFASDRLGGQGGTDIWVARRKTANVDWDPPVLVSALNSSSGEGPTWVSEDDCRIYLQSDRPTNDATSGSSNIWQATRPK
jgi:hypothetical protein